MKLIGKFWVVKRGAAPWYFDFLVERKSHLPKTYKILCQFYDILNKIEKNSKSDA